MRLSGQQRRRLQEALIDAFPDTASLEQMLSHQLDKNIRAIASEGSLKEIVFKLIKTAESQGWLRELVHSAYNNNSGNALLQSIAQELLKEDTPPNTLPKIPRIWQKRMLWIIPGVGVVLTINFINKQQSTAAILSLIFTVIITFILITQDFWQQLTAELSEICNEWQKQSAVSVAAWIKSEVQDLWIESTSPFRREYYQHLIYKCRKYETQGLDKDRTLELGKVFVPLKISATEDVAKVSQRMISQQSSKLNSQKEFQIWDFLAAKDEQGKMKFPHMVILGAPGSGKTTLLRHLTLIYATKQESKVNPAAPKLIPVLLYLREVYQQIVNTNPSLAGLISQQVQQLNPPSDWFADKLREKKCLVMLDGLDEVAKEKQRQQISRWVEEQMRKYPDTAFILTSRPNGYKTARLVGVEELEVQPFKQNQINDFLHHWYLQKEVNDNRGLIDEGVEQDAKTGANDLIQRIQNSRPLRAMSVNPLLLTMIATVHRRGSALPGKRVELYKEICEILLERRRRAKNIPDHLTASQKQSVLQVLALDMMQNNTREFTLSEGKSLIQNQLVTFPQNLANPEDFLKHIRDDCGLLVEKELGTYEFAHLSFQEYLAAVEIKDLNQENLLIENINNSWWSETIRLYAVQINNASNLIRAVIDMVSISVTALLVVCEYEEEGWRVDPFLRQQLIDKLDAGLESNDSEIFKLASEVKLLRRLSNLQPIDENLEIDTSYITCAEYQRFIDDKYSRQTLRLQNARFIAGNAKNPVTGISWGNAVNFCKWINLNPLTRSISNDENNSLFYYRLPTIAEAQNHSFKAKCWTINGSHTGDKRIWIVKNRISQEYTKLANYLAAGDWEKAAQETLKIMLQITNRENEGELDIASIDKLPCSCLNTIDQLWMQYSAGYFGWGVSEDVGSSPILNIFCSGLLKVSTNGKEIFSTLVKKLHDCGIERSSPLFAFDVITVNVKGQEIQWEHRQSEYFTENLNKDLILEMVAIPGGKFIMGSPPGEGNDSEKPQHEVMLQPFFMGKYPITQAQWRAVAALPKVNRDLKPDPSRFSGDKRPVEKISWNDAVEFCARLSAKTGCDYRLPTEAEWEYACRAGTTTPFYFGETITTELANYNSHYTYALEAQGTNRKKTTDVGSFPPNAFGLYDMHGNVWEWCLDDWHDDYNGAPLDGSPWFDDDNNLYEKQGKAVLRGSSWNLNPRNCRSASRYDYVWRDGIDGNVGFRVSCGVGRILQ